MRRIVLAALLLAALSGTMASGGEKYRVSIITKAMDSEWWRTVRAGAEKFASENSDMEVIVLAPDREINVQQQIQIIEDQITNRVNSLVIAPCGAQEVIPTLDKAAEAKIPVVIFDTDADWPKKEAYVGSKNYDGGKLAGEYIVKNLPNGGEVALITGVMGHQTHIDRVQGAIDQIKTNPKIKIVSQQPANSERALGMTVMENTLTTYPKLDFLFATNDEMALGASQAAQAENSKVKIIGFDGTTEARKAIKDGIMIGSIDGNAFGLGYESAKAGYAVAKGGKLPPVVPVQLLLITPETVN
ncbi:MAG: sugar ABC transporter substrate-binding protein [Planctomycetota bacterium]|jgi:ribose transport system substrate-binding protein|nr:sugar ABC transporter substrate-binding protein [Planctomycetota bacterium]